MSGDPFGVIGSVIDGQFRVDQWVGEGGFSSVYKGFHLGLQEPIAIKCLKLPPSLGREHIEQFQNRFRDESRIAYRLSQGNLHIVRSITSGTTTSPSGQTIPYMVLEWLDGITLAQDLRKRRDAGMKGRPLEEVIQMFAPASEALAYAHAHGVVHRDIKPANLFLAQTREGFRLKVLDFGMAKILSDGIGIAPMAQSSAGIVVFSAPYAAPEQFDPKIGSIGTWTDVYSLALVLLEAMTDRRIRNVDSVAECLMHAVDPAQVPTPRRLGLTVSNALDEVFARALAVNPRERAQDVGEFWGQLRNAMLRDAEEQVAAEVDSIPPGIDGDGDDQATIVAEAGLFESPEEQEEPTRNVDLNSPSFAQGGGLPPEVKDFLSRAQTQSARSQNANNQTMAMQPPAAGAAWPPTPLPAAGRPIGPSGPPQAVQSPQAGQAPQNSAGVPSLMGGFPMDSEGEPATMAMHSPLANQIYNPNQVMGPGGTAADPFAPSGALNSPQFKNAAALGMTMPLINNGPAMMPPLGQAPLGMGAPPGGYPGPAPGQGAPGMPGMPGMPGAPGMGQPNQPGLGQAPNMASGAGGYVAQGWPAQPQPGGAPAAGSAPASSSKMPIVLGAVVAMIVVLGGGLYFAIRYFQARQEASSLTAGDSGVQIVEVGTGTIPTAVATDPNAVLTAPTAALTAPTAALTAPTAPTAALTAPPPTDTSTTPAPTATAVPTATTHPTPTATPTGAANTGGGRPTPTPTPTSTGGRPTPTPANDGGFDQAAAQRSLHNMEAILASCKKPDGPTGSGTVRVTFANDGSAMSSVMIGPPFDGTPVGDCAASRFKMARVPKFDGPPGITNYSFKIAK